MVHIHCTCVSPYPIEPQAPFLAERPRQMASRCSDTSEHGTLMPPHSNCWVTSLDGWSFHSFIRINCGSCHAGECELVTPLCWRVRRCEADKPCCAPWSPTAKLYNPRKINTAFGSRKAVLLRARQLRCHSWELTSEANNQIKNCTGDIMRASLSTVYVYSLSECRLTRRGDLRPCCTECRELASHV